MAYGEATSYAYDAAGNMTQEVVKDGSGVGLVTYVNAFDAANRITSETRNGSATSYTYDATNQLLTAGTYTYSFDANGNRNMSGYATGADNRTSTDGTWTYTYDAAGNTVKKSKGFFAETWTYGYDDRNQLLWAEDRSTDGGTLIQRMDYTTDVYGNVVKEVVTVSGVPTTSRFAFVITDASPGVTLSVHEAWADLDASANVVTRYLLGDGQGQILARDTGTGVWLIQDRLGSVREIQDMTGAVVRSVSYDGFGNVISSTGSVAAGRFLFAGMWYDTSTGLSFAQWRPYNAATGSWTVEDPLEFAAGDANLKRYVGSNSINFTDLSGLTKILGRDMVFPWHAQANLDFGTNMVSMFGQQLTFLSGVARGVRGGIQGGAIAGVIIGGWPGLLAGGLGGALGGGIVGGIAAFGADNPKDAYETGKELGILGGVLGPIFGKIMPLVAPKPVAVGMPAAPPVRAAAPVGGPPLAAAAAIPKLIADAIAQVRAKFGLDCIKCADGLQHSLPGGRIIPIAGDGLVHVVYQFEGKILDVTARQYIIPARAGVWTEEGLACAGLQDAVDSGVFTPAQHRTFLEKLNERFPGILED